MTEAYFYQGRLVEARAAYLDHLGKIKDAALHDEMSKAKAWAAKLPVCKYCGDVAMERTFNCTPYGGLPSILDIKYCQDCWEEMCGRSNGSKQLRGKTGGSGISLGSDYASDGPAGRMGHYGVGGGMMDDIVRAAEEDR